MNRRDTLRAGIAACLAAVLPKGAAPTVRTVRCPGPDGDGARALREAIARVADPRHGRVRLVTEPGAWRFDGRTIYYPPHVTVAIQNCLLTGSLPLVIKRA